MSSASVSSLSSSGSTAPTDTEFTKELSMGDMPYPIPTFSSPLDQRQWMLEHMAGAFRIFARKGYTEGSAGHISIRDPVDPDTFWINPLARHFGLLKVSDMIHVAADGTVLNQVTEPGKKRRTVNMAGFKIHSALHNARPDVWAACHAHSIHGKAYSSFGKPLEMISQDVCTFYGIHDVYDDFGGVVLDDSEGEAIAKALGTKNRALILKNHGLLTVGSTVDEAAYLFTLLERSCQAQLLVDAAAAGKGVKPTIISDEAAEFTFKNTAGPDILYMEGQPDYEFELETDSSFLK